MTTQSGPPEDPLFKPLPDSNVEPAAPPTPAPGPAPKPRGPYGNFTPPGTAATSVTFSKATLRPLVGVAAIGVFTAVAIGAIGIFAASTGTDAGPGPGPGSSISIPAAPQPAVNVLEREGYDQMIMALVARTGSGVVFDAAIYPEYGIFTVPVDATSRRTERLTWRAGKFDDFGPPSLGTTNDPRFDVTKINPDLIIRLSTRARAELVEDPTSWYVLIRAADGTDPSTIYAYASNKFSEGGYLSARPDGTITRRVTW